MTKDWGGDRGIMTEEEWAAECGAEPIETTEARAKFVLVAIGVWVVMVIAIISLIRYIW